MASFISLVCLFAACFVAGVSCKFPTFIKQCSLTDSDFNGCFLQNAQKAIPFIAKGVKELGLPQIDVFNLGALDYSGSKDIKFHTEQGLANSRNFKVFKANYNQKHRIIQIGLSVELQCFFDFTASGNILEKPFYEKGTANVTFSNVQFFYDGKLAPVEKDNKTFLQVTETLDSIIISEKFSFTQVERDTEHSIISDEQQFVFQTSLPKVKRSLEQAISEKGIQVAYLMFNTFFSLVPEDEIFLP